MSELREPKPVKLFIGLIFCDQHIARECLKKLEGEYGEFDLESTAVPFEGTGYYSAEMGAELYRQIYSFRKLIKREEIVQVKLFTNNLEEVFSYQGKRSVNIDPGYIAQEHLILATAKGFAHRPYLGSGVYADLTMMFRGNEFQTLEWTYPDYGTDEMKSLFTKIRDIYVNQLK